MEDFLVKPFDARFSDVVGARVVHRVDTLQFIPVDSADKAKRMGGQLAVRVISDKLGTHLHTGEFVAKHREASHLLLIEVVAKGNFLERPPGFLKPAPEALQVFLGNIQNSAQLPESVIHAVNTFRHKCHTENRAVLGQQGVVAVVDKTSGRGDRLDLHAVLVRQGCINVVLHDLQLIHARKQATNRQHNKHQHGQGPALEQPAFRRRILELAPRHRAP